MADSSQAEISAFAAKTLGRYLAAQHCNFAICKPGSTAESDNLEPIPFQGFEVLAMAGKAVDSATKPRLGSFQGSFLRPVYLES